MTIPTTTFADVRQDVLDQAHGLVDRDGTTTVLDRLIKRAAREVVSDVDLRSTKRNVQLSLAGQNDTIYEETDGTYDLPTVQAVGAQENPYEYACPNDLKGLAIVDVKARSSRSAEYRLTSQEEFDRLKLSDGAMVAVSDNSWLRKLLATGVPPINSAFIHDCDTYNGNGTFTAVGGATSIATEVTERVEGDGAVSFSSDQGLTTAGIVNSTLAAVDLTDYENEDLYVWVKIPSATLLTSFTLRWGSSASNYWSVTVTRTHESLGFYAGWNLLRFAWEDATATGSPNRASIGYVSFFMTKDAAKAAATGWIVDRIIAVINSQTDLVYYSKYPWQSSTGAYLENATADADLLNADTDERDLTVTRACELVSVKLGKMEDAKAFASAYQTKRDTYTSRYPSESKLMQATTFRLSSLEGTSGVTFDTND